MHYNRFLLIIGLTTFINSLAFGVGGFMSKCYQGNGFQTGVVCEEKTVSSNTASYTGSTNVSASYINREGSLVSVEIRLVINDPNGYYRSFQELPALAVVSVCGLHRGCDWEEKKYNMLLQRSDINQNQFIGYITMQTQFNAGAEYTELTQWLTLTPYESYEKLVFDLR